MAYVNRKWEITKRQDIASIDSAMLRTHIIGPGETTSNNNKR
jgi:hypothetical protein